MGWKYEIVVLGEDGKNVIVHRNVSVAGKTVDILYVKRGYEEACIELRIGSSYGLEVERWREKARKEGLSDLNGKWQPIPSSIGNPPVSDAELKQINWVHAAQDDKGKWKNQGFNVVENQKKTIKIEEGVFETVYTETISIRSSSTFSLGRFYWLEPYFNIPDFQKKNSIYGIYIVFFDDPQPMDISWIGYPKDQTLLPTIQSYGNTVNLEIISHRMPNDVLATFHSFGKYHLTVYCGEKVLKKEVILARNVTSDAKLTSHNQMSLLIESSWREMLGHKENNGEKELRIEVEAELMYNPNAQKIKTDSIDSNTSDLVFDVGKINLQTNDSIGNYTKDSENEETVSIRYQRPQEKFADPYMGHNPREEAEKTAKALACFYPATEKKKLGKQLRFKVRYEKKSEIQEHLRENVSKMLAVVGKNDRKFKAPANNPCKYTAIEVSSPGRDPDLIFEETDKGVRDLTGNIGFNLVAGEHKNSSNVSITLKDLDTKSCRNKTLSHKGDKNVFDLSKMKQLGMREEDYKLSRNKLEMTLRYDYNKTYDTSLGKIGDKIVDSAWLFRYFWPKEEMKQSYLVLVNTCAYPNQMVNINVYPDIKWEVFFELGSSKPHLYTHTNMPAEYGIFKRHQEKALSASKKVKDIDLSLGLSVEYNDGKKVELTANIEESVRNVYQTFKTIRDALDVLSFKKNVDDNRDKLKARHILPKNPKSGTIPIFIEISSPELHLGGGWSYEMGLSRGVIRKGEIGIAADPLIAATGGIDLIACSTYIPAAGQIIKAILKVNDLIEWLTDFMSGGKVKYEGLIWFNLCLRGRLSIKGIYEFSSGEKRVSLESPMTITFVVELGLSAEVKVETVTISGKGTQSVKAGFGGEASTGLTFKPAMGYSNKEGFYLDLDVRFNGITITISGEAKYEKKKKDKEGKQETSSKGFELDTQPLALIEPSTIWQGRIYPFADK
ncbi:hypothetical protein PORCRE_1889 [Porphyromonas crevioricanis JCM 15906]|uniref:Uncharacterized protein n=1 Tax=Porphyromonas crevioricanis JCM 15906 TaxID=1305617 RepID=T1CQR0_9PORP|nr:hypothetical protein [Porphyromonas crevioricanis]GAD06167.1 hypothetical protein PORCRE_1889 [Porphyromonas crevioricanis JCM 15906]SKA06807.1 hypothetical protein SAMN02745203_01772 [Porphyromonas crevioricanis]